MKKGLLIAILAIGVGLGFALLPPESHARSDAHVSVLLYHHVSDSTPRVTSVTEAELREHLQYLKDNDFTVIDIRDAIAAARGEKEIPEKSVVITFDDAYQNIFTNGRPILNEFDVPWTLFVTTDPIGSRPGQYMSWDQIRELHEEGVVIANHSTDHAHLPRRLEGESERAWLQRMRENILSAEKKIKDEVGVSYKLFAYPYGEYNNKLADLVEELGFIGFGQHSGGFGAYSDFRAIPRFAAAGMYANLRTLGTKMAALNLPVLEAHYSDTLLDHNDTKPVLELVVDTDDFHRNQLNCFIRSQPHAPEWIEDNRFRIQASEAIGIGRQRYNCTAPSISKPGRFFWYSIQWIRPDAQGSWPD
ncbi:polysaccharide deacetylase family protein [Aliidiomarina halalkaliphila]|uniref:Polysaccharide deacetylase family protein n=1 Tax=Aliidiomarina halalkaliphila TaxID=2593535 RepID=A0A552X224_9GAMM|nr:polysaccharide deacetylase family protein [Aliidiomarina halalkaliphila]TRW48996.1 polysaccharide deacetylase family protein [Aliidiomarina halalkaliphila]